MTLSPSAIDSLNADVMFTRGLPRVRALIAILVLCALAAPFGAAVLVPADASVTNRGPHVISAREYREAAAKSAAKSGAARRGIAPGKNGPSDHC